MGSAYNRRRLIREVGKLKAIRFHEFGGPEVLCYEEVEEPLAGHGEVVVKLGAIGVNFVDTYQRSGAYEVDLPHVAGQEGAGEVIAVGDGVSDVQVGTRVAFTGTSASYADLAKVPVGKIVKLPDEVDDVVGAAILLQGMTAHYLAVSTFPLQAGQTCLVHAAAGGVGLILTQIAKMRGARVIGTVSTAEKAQLALEAGADEVIIYAEHDFVGEVKRMTSGEGVPVVYDSVGRDTFDGSIECLAPRGCMVLYGQSSGFVPPINPQVLMAKGSLFLTRPSLGSYTQTRDELDWRSSDLFEWVGTGRLSIRVGGRFALSEAAEAHRRLEGRATTGKVVLIP